MSVIELHDPRVQLRPAAEEILRRWSAVPDVAVIAGSGLQVLRTMGTVVDSIPFADLPGLSTSTIAGHGSELCLLDCGRRRVALFTGRLHLYEGHAPSTVVQQIALMRAVGCTNVILTNASGGLSPSRHVGDVVVVNDVIKFAFHILLHGANLESTQTRQVIDAHWHSRVIHYALDRGIPVHEGVFVQMLGPSYETRAEIRMLRRFGADIVGMSSAMEASWAASAGMRVSMISLVTNALTDTTVRSVTHEEVIEAGNNAQDHVRDAVLCAIAACPLDA